MVCSVVPTVSGKGSWAWGARSIGQALLPVQPAHRAQSPLLHEGLRLLVSVAVVTVVQWSVALIPGRFVPKMLSFACGYQVRIRAGSTWECSIERAHACRGGLRAPVVALLNLFLLIAPWTALAGGAAISALASLHLLGRRALPGVVPGGALPAVAALLLGVSLFGLGGTYLLSGGATGYADAYLLWLGVAALSGVLGMLPGRG